MKTIMLLAMILLAGWILPGQEIKDVSEKLGKIEKELPRMKDADRTLRNQVKQLKEGLEVQGKDLSGISSGLGQVNSKSDSLQKALEFTRQELEKADAKTVSSLNLWTGIALAGLFVVILLMVILMVLHRRLHEERSARLEALGTQLRNESEAHFMKLEEKLLSRIELLEEKVY